MNLFPAIFRGPRNRFIWLVSQSQGGRKEQQDTVAILPGKDGRTLLVVLADGAGGHLGGREASEQVAETAKEMWKKGGYKLGNPPSEFEILCREAHAGINRLGDSPKSAPRSTMVSLYIEGRAAWWANVGDSRLYRVVEGKVAERSKDHTMAQILCDQGEIRDEEIPRHPDRVQLLRALGGEESYKPSFGKAPVNEGDGFLLCSDGFWENTTHEEIGNFFRLGVSQTNLDALVKKAVETNGAKSDNVSACAVVCTGSGRA